MRPLMLAALFLTALSAAENHPDFSGTWIMDAERSDFGQTPKPASFVRKIYHQDPNVRIVTSFSIPGGEMVTDVKHTTDGKESVNTVRGSEVKSTMVWDGSSLQLTSKRNFNGADLETTERWTLTNKGKVLTVFSRTKAPQAEIAFTVVLNKE